MELVNAVNIEQSTLGSLIVDDTLSYKLEELNEGMFTVEKLLKIVLAFLRL